MRISDWSSDVCSSDLGKMLEKQPAGDMARIAHVRHRQPHERRYLLGLAEIMLGSIRKAFALQRDDALIALAGGRLIEGRSEERRRGTEVSVRSDHGGRRKITQKTHRCSSHTHN